MGSIKVYKGRMTGEMFFVGCRAALRVVRGADVQGSRGCGKTDCACGASDRVFAAASEEETEGFLRTTGTLPSDSLR